MEATRAGLVTGVPYVEHSGCRVCGGSFDSVLDMGALVLSDFNQRKPDWRYAPLELVRCRVCGLVQNRHTVERDALFRKYWYRSGVSETMRAALRELAETLTIYAGLRDGDTVLDIGSNDGTFLSNFGPAFRKVGFEPSDVPRPLGFDITTFPQYFNAETFLEHSKGERAKAVNASAVFYSVADPKAFIHDIAAVLAPDGVCIIQMNDLLGMVNGTAFDTICHEHTCTWSLLALQPLVERAGLGCFRVERNMVNGGSVRLFLTHKGRRPVERSVLSELQAEQTIALDKFALDVTKACQNLHDLLAQARRSCKRTYLYGASTRGTTILSAAGIDEKLVDGAAERDERKHGFLVPGTRIPIVSEEEAREKADYFLALPYHFIEQFLAREREWMVSGGEFIVPLPTVRKVGAG